MKLRVMAIACLVAGLTVASGGSANADSPTTEVRVANSWGGVEASEVEAAVEAAYGARGDWEQQVVSNVREAVGGKYNVVLANLNQSAESKGLRGLRLYGEVTKNWDHVGAQSVQYGLWIFEHGTFRLHADGGFQNWAFSGHYDEEKWKNRDGNVVEFIDADGSGESDPVQTKGDGPSAEAATRARGVPAS